MLVADLSHYDDADPERYPSAFRLAERLRAIVRAGTVIPGGFRLDSALRCHRRPGRRPCPGHLVVARDEVPARIIWRCSCCNEGGMVSGWEGSVYDLRPPRLFDDLMLSFEMTDDELDLLRSLPIIDPDAERMIYCAYRDGERLYVAGFVEEMEEMTGTLAAASNHEPDRRRRRRLVRLVDRLEAELVEL